MDGFGGHARQCPGRRGRQHRCNHLSGHGRIGSVADASPSVLVGRARERELLARALTALVAGTGSVVFVEGEAGIGKSRLLAHLAGEAAAAGCTVLEARASAFEGDLPYAVFTEALDGHLAGRRLDRLGLADPAALGAPAPRPGRARARAGRPRPPPDAPRPARSARAARGAPARSSCASTTSTGPTPRRSRRSSRSSAGRRPRPSCWPWRRATTRRPRCCRRRSPRRCASTGCSPWRSRRCRRPRRSSSSARPRRRCTRRPAATRSISSSSRGCEPAGAGVAARAPTARSRPR